MTTYTCPFCLSVERTSAGGPKGWGYVKKKGNSLICCATCLHKVKLPIISVLV